jgi:hypothetical protein
VPEIVDSGQPEDIQGIPKPRCIAEGKMMICERCHEYTATQTSIVTSEQICAYCWRDEIELRDDLLRRGISIVGSGILPYRKEYPKKVSNAIFYVPNTGDGRQFLKNLRKYVNPRFGIRNRGRGYRGLQNKYYRNLPIGKAEWIAVYIVSKRRREIIK